MRTKENTIKAIQEQGLLPLFFFEDADVSLEIMRTLYKCGIRVIEYTNRGKEALENFKYLIEKVDSEMPDLHLGIGTIKNTAEAQAFLDAGTHFVVCPVIDPAVGELIHEGGLLWIPGCYTPSEINVAHQMGAGIIKMFPANLLGPAYLSSIKDIFPGQFFVPTGGVEIEEENISNWFRSGVCAVGMGSKLVSKEIMANQNYEKLTELTNKTMEIIRKVR
ncbi:bifunctional 4-hydroxy-2-oxoglutarate aldolase/2-dehydro-3-deoxy-phosphogluconate aldolase [Pedobacter sp.]|uniref:bifunctional 4-hydroxy-2-oxoglutarate aldolase/2-dehydro-3-deoxy-phosphogluconate aldolase n=1 Tax=Pedobacter sp. TaxID=1411316 RepID=UPI003D7F97AF